MINIQKYMLNKSENISEAFSVANFKHNTEVIAKTQSFTSISQRIS